MQLVIFFQQKVFCWCHCVTANVDLLRFIKSTAVNRTTIHWVPIQYKCCDWACVLYLTEAITELFISAEQIERERKYIAELVFQKVYMGLIVLLQRVLEERTPRSQIIHWYFYCESETALLIACCHQFLQWCEHALLVTWGQVTVTMCHRSS